MKSLRDKKIHLAVIATYPEMAKTLKEMCEEEDVILTEYYASFGDAVRIAKDIQDGVDGIMSRGGTGDFIKKSVNIPVIQIPITPFDLTESINELPDDIKEVAFINFNRRIYGVDAISKHSGVKIHELTFRNRNDIEQGIRSVKAKGVRVIIGGNVGVEYAKKEGLTGIEISTGEEAIYRALQEAIALVNARIIEQEKSKRFQEAFDSITEAIVVSNEKKDIFIYNTTAEKIFGLAKKDVIGKKVTDVILDKKINKVFETKVPERDNLFNINNITANINHIPVYYEDKFIGVVSKIEDVTKIQNLEGQIRNKLSEKGFYAKYTFEDILTEDIALKHSIELAKLYASTNSSILVEGESGTGKEMFSQGIHNASHVATGPFVAVNCAAIPEQLLESELFGYEGGAFTGAKKEGKEGLFEIANNGTLFLDEIGEIPKPLQGRLLRALQEKEIMRVGGTKMIPINVRIISATNKNLKDKVDKEEFREDLYYRLNVFNIKIAPLRMRKDDIDIICEDYFHKTGAPLSEDKHQLFINEILPVLKSYDWPGNIRELLNVIERLSFYLYGGAKNIDWREMIVDITSPKKPAVGPTFELDISLDNDLKETVCYVEKEIIENVMKLYDNNQEKVAEVLGIGKTTLWRKMNHEE